MPEKLAPPVERVNRDVAEAEDFHTRIVEKIRQAQDAYETVIDRTDKAGQYDEDVRAPWVNHIVETTIASLIDERLAYSIIPSPRFFNPGEYEQAQKGARAHEVLMRQQLVLDRFSEMQRPFALQAAIAPLTVAKNYWRRDLIPRKKLVVEQELVNDPTTGVPVGFVPKLVEVDVITPTYEGPTTEVVNVEDFYFHEAASSPEKSRFFAHRLWMTRKELEKLAKAGVFENINDVPKPGGERAETNPRERDMRNRTKDMVSVIEHWDLELREVTWVAECKVLLRKRKFPFWHGGHPFVICSLQPRNFRLDAISIVEKLRLLQLELWDLGNQRLTNLKLINNAIWYGNDALFDSEELFELFPGKFIPVEAPDAVGQWAPNPIPAEVSIGAETILKADMQNLAGGQPFTSTSEARNIGANTATEASLVSSIGAMATRQMKLQLNFAYGRIGQQRMELNKQFIRKPIYVNQIGLDSEEEIMEILPQMLQDDYAFDISPMNESLMRQERRAEATSLFQVIMAALAPYAAVGVPINPKPVLDFVLDAFDIQNKEAWYSGVTQPMMNGAPGQPGQPGQPGNGVTGPGSVDPSSSPSNQNTMNPAAMMQRMLARGGGPQGGFANA